MKKSIFISILIGLFLIVILLTIGSIITIGDKIAVIHPFLSYLFYFAVGLLCIFLIIIPVIQTLKAPPINGFMVKDIQSCSPSEMSELIEKIRKNTKLTKEEDRDLRSGTERRKTIEKILHRQYGSMETIVKNAAVTNMVITAISQNGSFDMLSSMVISIRMINNLVKQLKLRPSYTQLISLYITVISASLVITRIDDIIDDIEFSELLGLAGLGAIDTVFSSLVNGLMNAFVTLRVGYATIKYLEVGGKNIEKREIRQFAIKSARKKIIEVGKTGISEIYKKGGKMINSVFQVSDD